MVGQASEDIAITPDGKTAYVANGGAGSVTPIATATNTAGPPIIVGGTFVGYVAITPDGKTAYANSGFTTRVTPIDTATNTAGTPITVGFNPDQIVVSPDGKTVWVADAGNSGRGTVTPIDTATNTAGTPIPAGNGSGHLAITPDGKTVYVVNSDFGGGGSVTPITTATNIAGPPIPVGSYPVAIAITPTAVPRRPAFTSDSATTAAFGEAFTFTVTTTGDPAPRITETGQLPPGVRFTDHGDGTATISGTPAKAAAGVYQLTLTARNTHGTVTQVFTLTVTRAPALPKIRTIRTRVGAALHLTIRATGYPPPALAESGPLPRGLTLTDKGNGTATIAGTPAAGSRGCYRVTITATNASGTATRSFKIIVQRRRR
jgi:DNA-binding beta-propeller fold protein YncE